MAYGPSRAAMLDEGRTTARVKALLEDIFRPTDVFSLETVFIQATDDMAKDLKHINFGYNNDLAYESCHRGISLPIRNSRSIYGYYQPATPTRRTIHADE
jgi:hypothetical protein